MLYLTPRYLQPGPPAAPAPYAEHQYYDGMNDFNDRYSSSFPNQAHAGAGGGGRYYQSTAHEYRYTLYNT